MSPKPKVLIVDDEEAIRSSLRMIFEYEGYECLLAANGQAAIKMVERESPDLVFLDIKMPQVDGMEVLKTLKSEDGSPPVVILSGHGTVATAVEATKLGAYDFIEKPPDRDRLLLVARNALSQRKLTEENRRFKPRLRPSPEHWRRVPGLTGMGKRSALRPGRPHRPLRLRLPRHRKLRATP